ncbi:hypothetical protein CROQUDRAFT_41417 [Cronartium quercuum f. sp. fusiforme G11]|uniref:holo-[acyl-carrier-protein] synthase n=1 Tax=Cronartium quercuum f. sp. fusiforme G11 TaxID=708437 RepID=A0A9P6NMQ3_9BASI|nr:hypothetical protein CROQUDRAFT_41417 [Cronartium quercuum f. sp. fusiforme G11]
MDLRLGTWAVDIHSWDPSPIEWKALLDQIDHESQKAVIAYHHRIDSQRCLIGKLLVRAIVCQLWGINSSSLKFSKTDLGRPYLSSELPNGASFDFNISHDSDLIVCSFMACFDSTLNEDQRVGVDVMKLKLPRGEKSVKSFTEMMSDSLTHSEFQLIKQPSIISSDQKSTDEVILDHLLQLWTLKESLVKGMGVGLSLGLNSINFSSLPILNEPNLIDFKEFKIATIESQSELKVTLNEKLLEGWTFWINILDLPRPSSKLSEFKSDEMVKDRYVLSVSAKLQDVQFINGKRKHDISFKTIQQLIDHISSQT